MNTKIASEKAMGIVDQYLNFRFGGATISVPYYNNNRKVVRAGLRGMIGKGSPRDIFDEVEIAMAKEKGAILAPQSGAVKHGSYIPGALTDESLKHFLVDHNIGIDCSGFAYYVLNGECAARGKGSLDRHLKFPFSKGILGKIRSKMRPVENADVATFAHEKNSRAVALKDVNPGDIITMVGGPEGKERDHILFIHQVDYQNHVPIAIHYSHSVAWPSDGHYGHGVRQGKIDIIDPIKPLTGQTWTEADTTGPENYTSARALKARTEIRHMVSW